MNAQAFTRFLQVATVADSSGQAEGLIYVRGTTVPTDAATGYAKGCTFTKTDAADHSDLLYINIGTVASCNFNLVTVASD